MILLDANAVIYYLHDVEPYSSEVEKVITEREDLSVTLRIVDEVLFTLLRLEAWRRQGIRRVDDFKAYIRKHGLKELEGVVKDVEEFIYKFNIQVLEDKSDIVELLDAIRNFNLLPGDALIAVTAKSYGIDTILTFDEDFKRVPWLRVIP